MSYSHISPELLLALDMGNLSLGERHRVERHVARCERCRKLVSGESMQSRPPLAAHRRALVPQEKYAGVLDAVFAGLLRDIGEIQEQRFTISELMEEFSGLSSSQQALLIQNSARYQTWPLAQKLLDACERGWSDDPSHSEAMARSALKVADSLGAEGFRKKLLNDLKAEAWSFIGNCRRIRSDLQEAHDAFRRGEECLEQGTADPLEKARFLDLRSSLLRARRDFEGAERLIAEVIEIYREAGDTHLEGRALLKRAKLLEERGRVAEALPALKRARALIDPQREPRLSLVLPWHLTSLLIKLDRLEEAQRLLSEVRYLVRARGHRYDRLRVLWVEGQLRCRLGQCELAEEMLRRVRDGFLAEGIGFDVALVSLDLAAFYLEAGRTEDARELATESIPLFTSRGIHREALAAWSLFRDAAERDALTVGVIQEVATRIRQAQSRPGAPD